MALVEEEIYVNVATAYIGTGAALLVPSGYTYGTPIANIANITEIAARSSAVAGNTNVKTCVLLYNSSDLIAAVTAGKIASAANIKNVSWYIYSSARDAIFHCLLIDPYWPGSEFGSGGVRNTVEGGIVPERIKFNIPSHMGPGGDSVSWISNVAIPTEDDLQVKDWIYAVATEAADSIIVAVGDSASDYVAGDYTINAAPNSCQITVTIEYDPASLAGIVTSTVNNQMRGYIVGTLSQQLANEESGTALLAIPNRCYQFVNWTDGEGNILSETSSYTPVGTGSDFTAVANFVRA